MFKINIQNNANPNRKWEAHFSSEQEANDWANEQKLKEGRSEEEATYYIENLQENFEWQLQKCYENRIKAYPSWDNVLHVLMDHGESSQEWADIQAERAAVKLQYPKPV